MDGIRLYNSNNNTVSYNSVTNVSRGIEIQYSNDNIILNNSILNSDIGILAVFSDRTFINNNTLSFNLEHIGIQRSTGAFISNNCITSGSERFDVPLSTGIMVRYSNHSKIENNEFIKSGILILEEELSDWNTHQIDASNTVNGRPIIYWCNQTGGTVPSGAGEVILANCTNVIINNQNLSESSVGLVMGFSNDNIVSDSIIDSNGFAGVYMAYSDNNNLYNNSICNNQKPFEIDFTCVNNRIYHNDFIDNNKLPTDFGTTFWDNSYPDGGNYWSDYNGVDFNSTPTQDVPPPDGIGDSPYFLDNYPLMRPIEFEFTNCTIPLTEGWNLVSLPLEQSSESLDAVLASIDGKWDYIQTYDALEPERWKSNCTFRPNQLNDFDAINHKMSFWVNITEPNVNLTVRGYVPDSTTIRLYAGWNLVGYPTLNSTMTVGNALFGTTADKVEVFDAADPYRTKEVTSTYVMKPGEGYWVHVVADTIWVVDW